MKDEILEHILQSAISSNIQTRAMHAHKALSNLLVLQEEITTELNSVTTLARCLLEIVQKENEIVRFQKTYKLDEIYNKISLFLEK